MIRARLNVFLDPAHAKRIAAFSAQQGLSKSSIVAAAVAHYFSPDGEVSGESIRRHLTRRLDQLSRHIEHLERDQTIQIETLALFIRHQLSVTTPIGPEHQDAARAQGRVRFEQFVEQLAKHLQRGGSLVRSVWQEISPEDKETSATAASPLQAEPAP